MVPRVGQRIGPYEILGRLGSGGMGLVYSAWDVRLQRDVAIKLLREEFLTPGMRSRFLQEARAASRLNHPNICTIFDIGEQQGDPYLVMELLKGETVRQRISRAAIPTEDIMCVASEVADALTVAHAQGIVHRDIKPANIILVEKAGGGFQAKVLDFGLAKVEASGLTGESRFDLTTTGTTVGTVSYMSPEQARGETLDARSDLFSLGVVLYEMSTGHLPFTGATSALVFVQLLSHRPEPVREFNSEIPKDLERVINKLLEKGRSDRYQNAREVVQALQRVGTKRPPPTKPSWGQALLGRKPSEPHPSGRTESTTSIPTPPRPLEASPLLKSPSSDSILRPVKRIVTNEWRDSQKPDSQPPAPSPLLVPREQAAPNPAQQPAANATAPASPAIAPPASVRPDSVPPAAAVSDSEAAGINPRFVPPPRPPRPLRPMPRAEHIDPDDPHPSLPRRAAVAVEIETPSHKTLWIVLVVVAALALAGLLAWLFLPHRSSGVASAPTSLLLGPLTNSSGDNTLGATVIAGLRFDLEQSPSLSIRDPADYAAGLKSAGIAPGADASMEDARRAARAVGASALLFGDIHSAGGSSYATTLRIYDANTGSKITEAAETASSREQIPEAIDRLASDLRSGLGESGDSISRTAIPLSREATSNLDALQAFVSADALLSQGKYVEAAAALQHAVSLEPHFVQADLRLAEIYRRQNAELSAAKAATDAQNDVSVAGPRLQSFAHASYAVNALGDYAGAIDQLQQIASQYPSDVEAQEQISLAQRFAGKYSDSLDTANGVLTLSPFNDGATGGAELAMIALDRADAAALLEQQSRAAGRSHPGIDVLIDFLGSRAGNPLAPDLAAMPGRLSPQEYGASVLDAQGQTAAGLSAWRAIADSARAVPELASAASYALAHAALDRALLSDCPLALVLAHQAAALPSGPNAAHATGMAAALCGDLDQTRKSLAVLTSSYAQNFSAKGIYIPNLTALVQWKSGDSAAALATLQSAKQNDPISLTPYLRGLIHLSSNQGQLAIVDFQSMLLHRGATTVINAEAYPLAQLGLARAYLAGGDKANGDSAYAKFLQQWSHADASSPLLAEARAHAR